MNPLLNNQKKAITHLETKKVGALFKAPGTGKTRAAIEIINKTDVDLVLWLAPLRSITNKDNGIIKEVSRWTNISNYHFVGIESIGMSDRVYLEVLNKIENKKVFVVCDESILIKNEEAIRTKRLQEISKLCEYKLILNGTPFSRNLTDLYSQMNFLSPLILNMSSAEFYNTFCKVKKVYKNKVLHKEFIIGYENIDYLYHLIKPFIYESELVLDIDVQEIELNYSINNKEEYEEIKNYFLENIEDFENNIFLSMVQKLQQCYCDEESKIELVKEIIKEHGNKNIAIYTKFIRSREALKKEFPKANIYSLQSESMSLNLQDEFNVTIEFDKTWDWKDVDQYKRRIFRTGQKRKVYHYYLTATNIGLDRLMRDNNNKKQNALDYFKKITKYESLQQIKECL